ncbi:MAG: amino acid permease [Candidatus Thorarchaeota archaeon]|nr:amino acid permease [Candidatus Thorarchaeota archaeon]
MTQQKEAAVPEIRVSLKRDIGWFGSFSMGYADVGADIYVALGLVAAYAAGWAPFAFLIAAVTYIATGLAYAELATAYPYAGGAQVYSMKAINDFAGFTAGWLVMLDYTVCTALFSIATTGYLSFFLPWLATTTLTLTVLGVVLSFSMTGVVSFLLVIFLMAINTIGIKESSNLNMTMVALNLFVLSSIMIIGLLFSFNLQLFQIQIQVVGSPETFPHISYLWGGNPSSQNFLYAVTLAMSSFIGIESIAQAAEETKRPDRTIPRATKLSVIAVLVFAVGLAFISLGIITWEFLGASLDAPISALASSIGTIGLYMVPIVAFTGFAICLVSSNTGIIGVSRVVFSMSHFGLLPKWFSKVNPKTRTPVRTILVFGSIGALMALIGQLDWVADLYNFGALLSYLLVNISLIILRQTDRETHRSWKVPFNLKIGYHGKKYIIPIPNLIGIVACFSIWLLVVLFHPMGRLLGLTWTSVGMLVYFVYRRKRGLPFFSKEIGQTIKPAAYKINAVVFVRPEERESIVVSIAESIDTSMRLTLQSMVVTDQWDMPLSAAIEYKESILEDLRPMAKELERYGFETKVNVVIGPLEKTVKDIVTSSDVDFAILVRRKVSKKRAFERDNLSTVISHSAPGKLMVLRRTISK